LDSSEAEKLAAGQSHSPPPMLGDAGKSAVETIGEDTTHSSKIPMFFSLKKHVCFPDLLSSFVVFLMNLACYRLTPFGSALLFSGYNFGHSER
jgi:hypothetical protein